MTRSLLGSHMLARMPAEAFKPRLICKHPSSINNHRQINNTYGYLTLQTRHGNSDMVELIRLFSTSAGSNVWPGSVPLTPSPYILLSASPISPHSTRLLAMFRLTGEANGVASPMVRGKSRPFVSHSCACHVLLFRHVDTGPPSPCSPSLISRLLLPSWPSLRYLHISSNVFIRS